MNIFNEILQAEKRIRPHILKTPLIESRNLSMLIEGKVFLKLENEQHTGSFKARGSLNKILSLSEDEQKRGVMAASTGNHALGLARALEITNVQGTVYLPKHASKSKIAALSNYPVELQFFGTDALSTELHAKEQAQIQNKVWVSPYNDQQIIGGQGTIGIELDQQLNHFDHVLVTIGGGGLISGIGTYLKIKRPKAKIQGCEPELSQEMTLSLAADRIMGMEEERETLSDGSAGGIEEGSITFPICQKVIDETILVTEDEIASAIKLISTEHDKIIEGAAGVAVASLIKNKAQFKGSTVVIVICGGNIDLRKFNKLLSSIPFQTQFRS
ncbi:MAG: threonine/serine dehydratase [Cytophagales bacterium]|nr:threonine/serine dehydratase [Cytophagales bacterium]